MSNNPKQPQKIEADKLRAEINATLKKWQEEDNRFAQEMIKREFERSAGDTLEMIVLLICFLLFITLALWISAGGGA